MTLQTGAGLQKFYALLRRTATGNNPTFSMYLDEGGVQKAALLSGVSVVSLVGQEFVGSWDASLLSDVSGAGVECRIVSVPGISAGALAAYSAAGTALSSTTAGASAIDYPVCTTGNLLIMVAHARSSNSNGTISFDGVSGWAQLGGAANTYGTGLSKMAVGWKIAVGGESTSTTVSVTFGGTGTVRFQAQIFCFTAANGFASPPITDVTAATVGTAGAGATLPMPTVIPGGLNRRAIAAIVQSASVSTVSATGEGGGDWTQVVAESSATNGTLEVQSSDQSTGARISGGTIASSNGINYVTLGFTIAPASLGNVNTVEVGAITWVPAKTASDDCIANSLADAVPILGQPTILRNFLTATALADRAPLVGQPAVGQKHALSATALADRAPIVGQPTVGQKHVLTATSLADRAPIVGQPTVGQKHALSATALADRAPLVGQPTAGQKHALVATSLADLQPLVGQSAVGQKHVLVSTGLADLQPLVGQPTVSMKYALSVREIGLVGFDDGTVFDDGTLWLDAAMAPVLGQPDVGQHQSIVATSLAGPAPVLEQPSIHQGHAFAATALADQQPTLGQPVASIIRNLTSDNLADRAPLVGQPAVGQKHALTATSLTDRAPLVGQPTAVIIRNLTATGLADAAPVVAQPIVGQKHALTSTSLADATVLGTPAVGQKHVLTASSLASQPILGQPSTSESVHQLEARLLASGAPVATAPQIAQEHVLAAAALQAGQPAFAQPTLAQGHALAAQGLSDRQPVLGQGAVGQEHALTATALADRAPVLSQPSATLALDALAAASLAVQPILAQPGLHEVNVLAAAGLAATAPLLGQPSIAAVTNLVATSLITRTPVLAQPSLAQVHLLAAQALADRAPTLNSSNIGFGYNFDTSDVSTVVMLGQPNLNRGYRPTGRAGMVNVAPGSAATVADRDRAAAMIEDIGPIAA